MSNTNYTVTINYDQTVEQLIKAGKFDGFSDDITSHHFPSDEKGVAEVLVYLVNFNRFMSSQNAVKELDRQGLRPATLKELLALGVAQSKLQRPYLIAALGSTWHGSLDRVLVPSIGGIGSRCTLELRSWDIGWNSPVLFAAVRK